jgi:hypothetical protein
MPGSDSHKPRVMLTSRKNEGMNDELLRNPLIVDAPDRRSSGRAAKGAARQ